MSSFNPSELIAELNFHELSVLALACTDRTRELRSEGVRRLAEQFDKQSREQLGLPAKTVVAALAKKRGRPRNVAAEASRDMASE